MKKSTKTIHVYVIHESHGMRRRKTQKPAFDRPTAEQSVVQSVARWLTKCYALSSETVPRHPPPPGPPSTSSAEIEKKKPRDAMPSWCSAIPGVEICMLNKSPAGPRLRRGKQAVYPAQSGVPPYHMGSPTLLVGPHSLCGRSSSSNLSSYNFSLLSG